jgi:rhamnosyltransferase
MPGVAGVVILYYPDTHNLYSRIESYSNDLDKLYIIDNSEQPFELIKKFDKVSYISDRENKGIANRLNQAAFLALKENFDWLLMMDQDSYFAPKNITNYLKCVNNFPGFDVAQFGVQFDSQVSQSPKCTPVEVTQLITSGSLLNLSLFKEIGEFNEDLFIDQVDFDYCYRAILKGYKNVQFKNIFMHHNLGTTTVHKSLKSYKNTARSLHSPMRLYYMTRNYFYISSRYKNKFPNEVHTSRKDLLIRIKNNFLYSSKRIAVLKSIYLGFYHFKRNKWGKRM